MLFFDLFFHVESGAIVFPIYSDSLSTYRIFQNVVNERFLRDIVNKSK